MVLAIEYEGLSNFIFKKSLTMTSLIMTCFYSFYLVEIEKRRITRWIVVCYVIIRKE